MYLLGLEILVSFGIDTLVVCIDLKDLHVGDVFYDAIGDLVPRLSGIFLALIYLLSVCKCSRFVLDPIVVEASLTFAWCTCYPHGVWRWFFMVYGDGSLHGLWR